MFKSFIVRCVRSGPNKTLLLQQLIGKDENLTSQLTSYLKAKDQFDYLVEKYQIFVSKEKSTSDAANLVGLRVPIEYKEPS